MHSMENGSAQHSAHTHTLRSSKNGFLSVRARATTSTFCVRAPETIINIVYEAVGTAAAANRRLLRRCNGRQCLVRL